MLQHPLYKRGTIYLSGGMQHATDLGAAWRIKCSSVLKKMEYFPLDITALDVEYTKQHGELYRSFADNPNGHLQMKSNIRKHFVYTDLELIKNDSDALIVYYDESVRRGAGTISESQVAYNLDLPVFVMSAYENWNKEVPGWLQSVSTKIFTDFIELYAYLDDLPYGILKRDVYGNHNSGSMYLCSLCGTPFEKHKHHFVSKISPLYCSSCIELVKTTYEGHKDRYEFFIEHLEADAKKEMK